jgi:hypothetical protein
MAAVVGALLAFSVMLAQSEVGLDHRRAGVARSEAGHPLTPASQAGPEAIVGSYLTNRGRSSEDVASLRTTGVNAGANGVTHVRMEQQVDGVSVYGAYVKAAINSKGELVSFIDRVYDVTKVRPSRIDESQALTATMARLYPSEAAMFRAASARGNTTSYDGGPFFYGEPTVTAVALPMEDGSLQRGWLVQTWTAKSNELYHTVVDGNGRVLDVESRTANDSYNVYTEDPLKGGQNVVNGPGGWLGSGSQTTINISGNNAHAYLDVDANNSPDSGGTAVTDGNFLTGSNLAVAPTTAANKAVAVQNLFYLNNTVHDILYSHGFNEAAGNFQTNNFGNGGSGNDPVNAEAQDGSGTDNANFATPADGSSPRMQMYLWTGFGPNAQVTVNATDYGAFASAFGPAITATGITGPLANMTPAAGCTAAAAGSLSGKVAIIDRGTCDFTVKVLNAQNAGATAAIIANNVAGNPFGPGGTNRKIKIPSAMVSQTDGTALHGFAGQSSRLHNYTVTPLQIDGDIDADIVFHEYGHGLTWRMIGGMSGKIAGAIGEGAADVNAFLINRDDRIGEYAYSDPLGIRRYPYDDYQLSYKDFTGAEVHNDGEIYAAAMWQVYQNYLAANLQESDVQEDFVDGMNFTPTTPTFENMRDGMISSVNVSNPSRACLIWRGFASKGIGVGSSTTISRRGTASVVESFAVPAGCTP